MLKKIFSNSIVLLLLLNFSSFTEVFCLKSKIDEAIAVPKIVTFLNKSDVHYLKSEFVESIYNAKCALELSREFNIYGYEYVALGNLGKCSYRLRQYDNAKSYFYKAIEICDKWQESELYLCHIYLELGATYNRCEQLDSAILCSNKAKELALFLDDKVLESRAKHLYIDALSRKGEIFNYISEFIELYRFQLKNRLAKEANETEYIIWQSLADKMFDDRLYTRLDKSFFVDTSRFMNEYKFYYYHLVSQKLQYELKYIEAHNYLTKIQKEVLLYPLEYQAWVFFSDLAEINLNLKNYEDCYTNLVKADKIVSYYNDIKLGAHTSLAFAEYYFAIGNFENGNESCNQAFANINAIDNQIIKKMMYDKLLTLSQSMQNWQLCDTINEVLKNKEYIEELENYKLKVDGLIKQFDLALEEKENLKTIEFAEVSLEKTGNIIFLVSFALVFALGFVSYRVKGKDILVAMIRDLHNRTVSTGKNVEGWLIDEKMFYTREDYLQLEIEKLNELNLSKNGMVYAMSHEIRNPLTSIYTNTEIIEELITKDYDPVRIDYYLKKIKQQGKSIEGMLDDVTTYHRIEGSMLCAEPEMLILDDFIRDMISYLNDVIGINRYIKVFGNTNDLQVFFDKKNLKLIFSNLFSNAIKYSSKNSNIELHIIERAGFVEFKIKDYGIGIPSKDLELVFEPFARSANALDIKGTGLGLSIVKNCLKLGGGAIAIASTLNEGTEVTFSVPKC